MSPLNLDDHLGRRSTLSVPDSVEQVIAVDHLNRLCTDVLVPETGVVLVVSNHVYRHVLVVGYLRGTVVMQVRNVVLDDVVERLGRGRIVGLVQVVQHVYHTLDAQLLLYIVVLLLFHL